MSLSTLARLTLVGFSASALGLLAALPARALSFSQTVSFGLDNSNNINQTQKTDLTGTPALTLNLYNGSLPLKEVDLSIFGELQTSGSVTNIANQAQSTTFDVLASRFDFNTSGASALNNNTYQPLSSVTIPGFGAIISSTSINNLPVNGTANIAAKTISGTASDTFTTNLNSFVGPGAITFNPFATIATYNSAGGGNLTTSINTYVGARYTITYITADAVPFEFSPLQGFALGVPLFFGLRGLKKRLARKSTASKAAVAGC